MKTLVIRQPWAWAIIHGGKDIENRTWDTKFRGRFLVSASKNMSRAEYDGFIEFVTSRKIIVPGLFHADFRDHLKFGGIIGSVELTDVMGEWPNHSKSPWYCGEGFGFKLDKPKALKFMPIKGRLGFFDTEYAK